MRFAYCHALLIITVKAMIENKIKIHRVILIIRLCDKRIENMKILLIDHSGLEVSIELINRKKLDET